MRLNEYRTIKQILLVFIILAGAATGITLQTLRSKREASIRLVRRSELKYRGMIQNLMEGFFVTSMEGELLEHNRELSRILGMDLEGDHRGISVLSFWNIPENRDSYFQQFGEKGYVKGYEIEIKRADGVQIIVQINSRIIQDEAGNPQRIEGTMLDITQGQQAKQALIKSEQILKESQEVAQLGSYELFMDTGVWVSSTILDQVFGIEASHPKNIESWLQIVHPDDRETMDLYFREQVVGKKKMFNREYRILKQNDKQVRWVHGFGKLDFSPEGDPIRMIGTIQDITSAKHAQERIELALSQAEAANQVKDQFVANISHEIRTPLTSMIGFSDLLKEKYQPLIDETDGRIFDFIINGGDRLLRTVDSILNISQIEAGAVQINPEKVNLLRIAERVVTELTLMATEKGITLELEQAGDIPEILSDEYCLYQTILNLTENAIKYTFEGGISLRFGTKEGRQTLSVIDSGIGISEGYLARIFEPYTQESEGFSKEYQGIGLGMALSKRYLDLIDTDIEIDSQKGSGSTFTLIFPNK